MDNMVSIIIPTFNRSDLLGATLESMLAQTYKNWECILVDDGSNDYTQELMEFYCKLDSRVKYHQRPSTYPKGANTCRNYGFELSKGEYIQWFDSDDLMVPCFLETKLRGLQENNVDFVISKCANFRDPDPSRIIDKNEKYYKFKEFEITKINYITQNINWLTPDVLGKKELFQNVRFNENLHSAQERNFFSKLICVSENCHIIDEFLTLRRKHETSIQSSLQKNSYDRAMHTEKFLFETWKDISVIECSSQIEFFFLSRILKFDQRRFPKKKVMMPVIFELLGQKRFKKIIYYFLYKLIFRTTERGFYFRKKFQNC